MNQKPIASEESKESPEDVTPEDEVIMVNGRPAKLKDVRVVNINGRPTTLVIGREYEFKLKPGCAPQPNEETMNPSLEPGLFYLGASTANSSDAKTVVQKPQFPAPDFIGLFASQIHEERLVHSVSQ